jgi:hypothetical protein
LYKLNNTLIFSIIIHLLLFGILSLQFSKTEISVKPKKSKVKPIQATLYFPPIKRQKSIIIKPVSIKQLKKKLTKRIAVASLSTRKVIKRLTKAKIEQQATNIILTSKTSTKSIAQRSLDKLKKRLNAQALKYSQKDHLNQYITDKNSVAASVTKFNQLTEAKAKIKEVDCNSSGLNTAIMVLSGFMGGSIRCNRMPDLQAFLDRRTKKNQ